MTSLRFRRHLPAIVTILIALMLVMMPLPDAVRAFRPDWVALILIFWALASPHDYGVGTAFIVGLVLDVAQGTMLGQHALALCAIVYVTIKFHLLMRMFPLGQMSATVFAIIALYQFLLFWINGVAGVASPAVTHWGPVVTGALIWPFLYMFLSGLRYRGRSGA